MDTIFNLLKPPKPTLALLLSPSSLFSASLSLRLVLILYGHYQDTHSALKYTDVDYVVFTDAARAVARGYSPYARDTYRYTPLLAWLLLPATWDGGDGPRAAMRKAVWGAFGKGVFAGCDVLAGWMIWGLLRKKGVGERRALGFAAVWLLNPMVATISTRGSSEGLLCVMVMGLLWAVEMGYVGLAGAVLGLAVHFKIYPFIYGVSILLSLETETETAAARKKENKQRGLLEHFSTFMNPARSLLLFTSLATFSALNMGMYALYGLPFIQHTYLHHLTRLDHRHNFSPYNTLLYLTSASPEGTDSKTSFASLAFIPQLLLSTILIPLVLILKPTTTSSPTATTTKTPTKTHPKPTPQKINLPRIFLTQTHTFVTLNKVITSQYFLWYLIFLPLYVPTSILLRRPYLGISTLLAWVSTQALWLYHAYNLEMLGHNTFVPGLWVSGLAVFVVNVWILGIVVADSDADADLPSNTSPPRATGSKFQREIAGQKTLAEEGVFSSSNSSSSSSSSSSAADDGDDSASSSIEEIPRNEPTIDEMVRDEMRRRKLRGEDLGASVQGARDRDRDEMLREYLGDLEGLGLGGD